MKQLNQTLATDCVLRVPYITVFVDSLNEKNTIPTATHL